MSKFYKIRNIDGKCWWMPVRGMRVGLALYQPSGWKGRLLKCLLPWLHWSWLVRKALGIETVDSQQSIVNSQRSTDFDASRFFLTEDIFSHGTRGIFSPKAQRPLVHGNAEASPVGHSDNIYIMDSLLRRVVCEAFGVREFDYSVFGGTPSVHQKATIQVWNEERILGYVKLTESEEVGRLFFQEMNFLKKVNDQRSTINGLLVPEAWAMVLGIDKVWVLIQTTRKSLRSEMVREWGELQESFLERLYDATVQDIEWEESDVAKSLCDLREHIDWLPNGVDGEAVVKRIDAVVECMKGKRVRYGAYHGDFTPWNMFVEEGELFVFDWEYAGMSYPKGLDRYHFWMQTAIFEKHWGMEELRRYICSVDGEWIDREMLEVYVLDVMSKYVMREGEKVKDMGLFGIWCSLLKEL